MFSSLQRTVSRKWNWMSFFSVCLASDRIISYSKEKYRKSQIVCIFFIEWKKMWAFLIFQNLRLPWAVPSSLSSLAGKKWLVQLYLVRPPYSSYRPGYSAWLEMAYSTGVWILLSPESFKIIEFLAMFHRFEEWSLSRLLACLPSTSACACLALEGFLYRLFVFTRKRRETTPQQGSMQIESINLKRYAHRRLLGASHEVEQEHEGNRQFLRIEDSLEMAVSKWVMKNGMYFEKHIRMNITRFA